MLINKVLEDDKRSKLVKNLTLRGLHCLTLHL